MVSASPDQQREFATLWTVKPTFIATSLVLLWSSDPLDLVMSVLSRRPALFCLAVATGLASLTSSAVAAECPGNPDALGTARTLVVDPTEHPRIGTMQYGETLPLRDHEVVLTFDDGPLPPHSAQVYDMLAAECIKANFFLIGRMAKEYPAYVQR